MPAQRPVQSAQPSWDDIQASYQCPEWFANARLGIWTHWGPQSQPVRGGGWYARHLYMADVGHQEWGREAYSYHQKTYGHQSEFGHKDVCHAWKADQLDTDALLDYARSLGGRYFVAMANHHDHFDNFASSHHPWNSVNVGPRRDIIGEFEASARAINMPFGVTSHDDRMVMYYEHAFGADVDGPLKGVPYDGRKTKADGVGTWWEGLDPRDLYGPPPEERTDAWLTEMKQNWLLRHRELITRYDPDFLWFDGYGFPYGEYGQELCREFYANDLAAHGEFTRVLAGKIPGDRAVIQDVERGVPAEIIPEVWQSITSFTGWFYEESTPIRHSSRTLVETLVDVNSKNGNLLLNLEPYGNGAMPADHMAILDPFGSWVGIHAEAIYGSKPWFVHGDNLATTADGSASDNAADGAHFNERTVNSPAYRHDEVRFTSNGEVLYVHVLNPQPGQIRVPVLGTGSEHRPGTISHLRMVGNDTRESIPFTQTAEALEFEVPSSRPSDYTAVFAVTGARTS